MIISIEARDQENHSGLLDQIFKGRKRVFHDHLGWKVEVQGDWERDQYDDLDPVYLVLTDDTCKRHLGSMRLMPTTGPTLLHDVFQDTMPEVANLSAPEIWECTRFFVDEDYEMNLGSNSTINASSLLLLGMCELGLKAGIEMIVANFDPIMKRIYKRAGCEVEVHGVSRMHGKRPVACGSMEVSPRSIRKMRNILGISENVYFDRQAAALQRQKKAA